MSLRVAISGYYGFGNTGDEAIALAIIKELKREGHQPVLLSNTPIQSSEIYGCKSILRSNPREVLQEIIRCNVLISGGGGLLQDKTSQRSLSYYLTIIRLAKTLRKSVVVFNQSIGPLSDEGNQQVKKALDHKRVKVLVRDKNSQDYLRRLRISSELGADPALLLRPSEGITPQRQSIVVAPRGDVRESLEPLRKLVKAVREKDQKVIALSLMPSQDDEAAHFLKADQVISTTNPQEALDIIASSGYVVGVRLHALILAAAARVPFAGISYDPKVKGFCQDSGALVHDSSPNASALIDQVYGRVTPQWAAIESMCLRAMQSFGAITGVSRPTELQLPDSD